MKIETPISFIVNLQWTITDVMKAKNMLAEWDLRHKSFYKKSPKYIVKVDLAEREHLRNCIQYWENILKNENKHT